MALEKHVSLNLDVRGLTDSATLSINERCARLKQEGKKIYNFGLGQSPFPVPVPVVDALKLNAHQKNYLPVRGLPALRDYFFCSFLFTEKSMSQPHAGFPMFLSPRSWEKRFISYTQSSRTSGI